MPRDYEDLSTDARTKLVEVPTDVATEYWRGDGHNSAGKEWETVRAWAMATFKAEK